MKFHANFPANSGAAQQVFEWGGGGAKEEYVKEILGGWGEGGMLVDF